MTSRISVVSRAAPAMRDFSTSGPTVDEGGEIEASADAAEFANLGGQFLLASRSRRGRSRERARRCAPGRAARRRIRGGVRGERRTRGRAPRCGAGRRTSEFMLQGGGGRGKPGGIVGPRVRRHGKALNGKVRPRKRREPCRVLIIGLLSVMGDTSTTIQQNAACTSGSAGQVLPPRGPK